MINMPPNGFLLSGNLQALRWVDIFLAVLHAFIYTVFFFPTIKFIQGIIKRDSSCTPWLHNPGTARQNWQLALEEDAMGASSHVP